MSQTVNAGTVMWSHAHRLILKPMLKTPAQP